MVLTIPIEDSTIRIFPGFWFVLAFWMLLRFFMGFFGIPFHSVIYEIFITVIFIAIAMYYVYVNEWNWASYLKSR